MPDASALRRSERAEQRMIWLLRLMTTVSKYSNGDGFIVAWEADVVDEFVRAFPESLQSLRIYTLGAHVSPMLNRAAKRAEKAGYIEPGSIGNEDARSYGQRTWARTWSITPAGRRFLASLSEQHMPAPDRGAGLSR